MEVSPAVQSSLLSELQASESRAERKEGGAKKRKKVDSAWGSIKIPNCPLISTDIIHTKRDTHIRTDTHRDPLPLPAPYSLSLIFKEKMDLVTGHSLPCAWLTWSRAPDEGSNRVWDLYSYLVVYPADMQRPWLLPMLAKLWKLLDSDSKLHPSQQDCSITLPLQIKQTFALRGSTACGSWISSGVTSLSIYLSHGQDSTHC